jgi:sterol desaturase/sphingolipid hydroxylase (fatty acid hydroxylase superfamily)
MDWLAADSCAAATAFGWWVRAASGLYAVTFLILLILFVAPYDLALRRRRRARQQRPLDDRHAARRLRAQQWIAFQAELIGPALLWIAGAWHTGMTYLDCYAWSMALGAFIPLSIVFALFILGTARRVGSASAR